MKNFQLKNMYPPVAGVSLNWHWYFVAHLHTNVSKFKNIGEYGAFGSRQTWINQQNIIIELWVDMG